MLRLLVPNIYHSFSYQAESVPPTRSADPPSPSNTVESVQVCNISDLIYSANLLKWPLKRIVFYDLLSPLDVLFDSQKMVHSFIDYLFLVDNIVYIHYCWNEIFSSQNSKPRYIFIIVHFARKYHFNLV
jgi:hypothetical protein